MTGLRLWISRMKRRRECFYKQHDIELPLYHIES